jgi:ribose/xylose/arabinose/galactoside ABC-type transport system permease subunit
MTESAAPTSKQPLPAGAGLRLPRLSGPVLGLVVVLGLFIVLVGLRGGLVRFLSVGNAQVLVLGNTMPAVVALGMLLIMISGGIDLSVGSVVALVTVVTMWVYRLVYAGLLNGDVHLPWPGTHSVLVASLAAVLAGVATGALCGLVNGSVVTGLRLSPFVATLGMYSVARGLALWLADRNRLDFPGEEPAPVWVSALATTTSPFYRTYYPGPWALAVLGAGVLALLGAIALRQRKAVVYALGAAVGAWAVVLCVLVFDPGLWSLIVLALAVAALLRFTVLGRYCYAIGSNEATARLCGVPIGRTKLALYTLAGVLTGWAGVLSFAHMSGGDPNSNVGLELIVIAAVVIGGATLSGGQGTVLGTLLGVLVLGVLENGVSAFNVPIEVKWILIGVIIIANTALSQWQRRQTE